MPRSNHYTGVADDSGAASVQPVQAGVLLVNLGTPTAPTAQAVRPYLAEFLGDPRVIDYPRWLWWLILHGVILRVRPKRSAHAYARIWDERGSPLRYGSEALAAALQAELDRQQPGTLRVALAMRYGEPSVAQTIEQLQRDGVRRLLVLPLYPQYSATSTGSVIDAVADAFKQLRWPPELRIINDYHDEPGHIDALAAGIERWWAAHGRGEKLLLSFHGIPERYVRLGDPYAEQCRRTAQLLRERLRLGEDEMVVSFQSRVGRERWLQPYTDATVRQLAADGVKRLDVACPGFAVDCLETLEEIAMQNRDFFIAAGGETLRYIPALNDSAEQVNSLAALVRRHLGGWPEAAA
ncbi:ferrochelatase [Rhodanobacter sp. B2A1Ga4]|uniref:ferrochelatase n=1 Tax=Rhodanobacter sp. B2A1Ga4 TaxID=2778647 RepID=UPI001B359629|nr:ferrochelatase [Rhodanobacter sp. B2A1Ga4]MBQ4855525.1 ferrochelatase [Rhodanobacter sp. B2A1Ga4]